MTRDDAEATANESLIALEAIVGIMRLLSDGESVPGFVVRWLADQVAGERRKLADICHAMQEAMDPRITAPAA